MTTTTNTSRRHFIVGSSAIATGLAIVFDLSLISSANAAMGTGNTAMTPLASPEIGVWVVVKPNDDVIVRKRSCPAVSHYISHVYMNTYISM